MRRTFLLLCLIAAASTTGCFPFATYHGMTPLYPPYAYPTLASPAGASPATVQWGSITLPTVPMETISWFPPPFGTDSTALGYPHLRADRSRLQWNPPKPVDRTHRTIVLENEYLKVTMLPDLGGRLFEAVFKPTGQQVFYRATKLTPFGLWNVGKEWMFATAGLRFEFPHWGHDPNSEERWTPTLRTFPNGSACASFRRVDARTGLVGTVHVSLDPGRAWIRVNVEIENPTDSPRRGSFWCITGMAGTPEVEFVVPTRFMIDHGGEQTMRWPKWRGVDWSRFGNWPWAGSFFALHWHSDFSGLYDHGAGHGVVRWARPADTPGLKLWGEPHWGPRFYVSIYGGLTQTMEERVTFSPGVSRRWEETWYPVFGTRGITFANRQACLSVHAASPPPPTGEGGERAKGEGQRSKAKGQGRNDIVLGLQTTRAFTGTMLRVTQDDEVLLEKRGDLSPAKALVETVALKGTAPLSVTLTAPDGRELLGKTFALDDIQPAWKTGK